MQKKELSYQGKIARLIWNTTWLVLFRPSPVPFHAWRCFLLRLFGAKIGRKAEPYPSVKIWAPWNLTMGEGSCLSHHVDCYCVDKITIGKNSTISQYSFLCTASHDYSQIETPFPLLTAPIEIKSNVWVTASVFIGPGVIIGDGAIVGARSVVTKNVNAWTIVVGHPARFLKKREIKGIK